MTIRIRENEIEVRNCFFWWDGQETALMIADGTTPRGIITNCVFIARPKWWQVRAWIYAMRLWLTLKP